MTKPVIEPSDTGQLSNYGWRIRQLERRPGQAGAPGCTFQAFRNDYTAAGNAPFAVDGEGFAVGSAFNTNAPDVYEWSVADQTDVNGARPWFTVKQEGRYIACWRGSFDLHHTTLNRAPIDEGEVNVGFCVRPDPESFLSPTFLDRYGMHANAFAIWGNQQVVLVRTWILDLNTAFFDAGITKVAPLGYIAPAAAAVNISDVGDVSVKLTRIGEADDTLY